MLARLFSRGATIPPFCVATFAVAGGAADWPATSGDLEGGRLYAIGLIGFRLQIGMLSRVDYFDLYMPVAGNLVFLQHVSNARDKGREQWVSALAEIGADQ